MLAATCGPTQGYFRFRGEQFPRLRTAPHGKSQTASNLATSPSCLIIDLQPAVSRPCFSGLKPHCASQEPGFTVLPLARASGEEVEDLTPEKVLLVSQQRRRGLFSHPEPHGGTRRLSFRPRQGYSNDIRGS